MPYTLYIDFADNKQIGPFFIGFAAIIFIGIVIALIAFSISDKRKAKSKKDLDLTIKREKVMDKVVRRENEPARTKTVHQVKRETRDPVKKQEQEAAEAAAVSNTLVGGTSEAQRVEKHAEDYYGQLGISSRRSKQLDKAKDRAILNGYLQKSNTAPIRPVYSNTPGARQQQMDELNSDRVGDEANTPALVMDSAAPSAIRYTDNTYHRNTRQKAIQLKRPSSSRAVQPADKDNPYASAIRPETGTEVSNAEVDFIATVPEEKPDILKSGEEAIIPAAQEPVSGFVPDEEVLGQNSHENAENA